MAVLGSWGLPLRSYAGRYDMTPWVCSENTGRVNYEGGSHTQLFRQKSIAMHLHLRYSVRIAKGDNEIGNNPR